MRHRIFTEPAAFSVHGRDYARVWRVQLAGEERPIQESALTHAGAVQLLEDRLKVNEWWAAQDPAGETSPAASSLAAGDGPRLVAPPPVNRSWWARFLP